MAKWGGIHPAYLQLQTLRRAASAYHNNHPHSIQLTQFLLPQACRALLLAAKGARWKRHEQYGQARFATAALPPPLRQFLAGEPLQALLHAITGRQPGTARLFAFRHRDYTLLSDGVRQPAGTLFQLELTPRWQAAWGGFTSFVANGREPLRITPMPNSLVLAEQQAGVQQFVKYVNHHAGITPRIMVQGALHGDHKPRFRPDEPEFLASAAVE